MSAADPAACDAAPDAAALAALAERHGTPLYVYDLGRVAARAARLRVAFDGRVSLSYAVKANPHGGVLSGLRGLVETLDVSSLGEFRRAIAAGWQPGEISFTGPGKRPAELAESIGAGLGELVIEHPAEARAADAIARAAGRVQDVLVRITPPAVPRGFGDTMAGRPVPFGIDAEEAVPALREIATLPGLRLTGLHFYSGTQCLSAPAIAANYRIFHDLAAQLCAETGLTPARLVFGAGMGIPYHETDAPLDLPALRAEASADLDRMRGVPQLAGAAVALELGRYLVGPAGWLLTRVVAVKHSRGHRILICDAGLNNHLAAAGRFGMVLHRNYRMSAPLAEGEAEPQDVFGPLCTSLDRLASGVTLPPLDPGGLIAIHMSGAYGLTASPTGFISHPVPGEIVI